MKRGFHLVDCMLAVIFVTVGMTASAQLCLRAHRHLARIQEHTVVWTLLTNVMVQDIRRLETMPRRFYDAHGLPCHESDAQYVVDIVGTPRAMGTEFIATVTYTDFDGMARRRSVSRMGGR